MKPRSPALGQRLRLGWWVLVTNVAVGRTARVTPGGVGVAGPSHGPGGLSGGGGHLLLTGAEPPGQMQLPSEPTWPSIGQGAH